MKRFLGISLVAFIALIAFTLISVDTTAVAGLRDRCGCHGRSHKLCERLAERRQSRKADCCEPAECSDCTSGCADGNCGGGSVITEEAAPTEAAPKKAKKNKKKEAPEDPAKT